MRLPPLIAVLTLCACREVPTGLRAQPFSGQTGGDGLLWVDLDIDRDDRSFLVTALGDGERVSVEAVYSRSGATVLSWEDWWDSDESLTDAIFPYSTDTVLNWPVRGSDTRLRRGLWSVVLAATDRDGNYLSGVDIAGTVQIKQDDALQDGVIRVLFVFAEGLDEDPDLVEAVDGAVARWEEIWGAYGIRPRVEFASSDADPNLTLDTGSELLEDFSAQSTARDVLVVLGEDINRDAYLYGIAGSIPGTLGSTQRAGVYLSWLANAGGDGRFSDEDIRLFGETMAHEVGHYAGLYHPVESSYDLWDALPDTVRCDGWQLCEGRLGDNLMFPYPVCDTESCLAQDQLTADQAEVFHLYTGTL